MGIQLLNKLNHAFTVSASMYQPKGSTFFSLPPILGVPTSTVALTANNMSVVPFIVGSKSTVTAIGMEVTTAGAGDARLGIYTHHKNCLDAATPLLLDAGTVSISTTGFKYIDSLALTLEAGMYMLVVVPSVGVTLRAFTVTQAINLSGVDAVGGNGLTSMYPARICSYAYAALPSTPPVATGNHSTTAPAIVLRLA